jgi:nitrous oxidase accessory protein NosD
MDQAIDMEPSRSTMNDEAPRNIQIVNNQFYDTATLALTITGVSGNDPARNIVVSGNEFDGAGIFLFNAVDVRIAGNTIRSGETWAPIQIRKRSRRILIEDNFIDSRATRSAAIVLTYHTSEAPKEVSVVDNRIQTGSHGAYFARDAEGLKVVGNSIAGHSGTGIVVSDVNPDSPLRGFLVEGNTLTRYEVGIRFTSREDPMWEVCVMGNTVIEVGETLETMGRIQRDCD